MLLREIGDWCCGFAGLVFGSVVFKLIGANLVLIWLFVGLTIGLWFEILDLAVFQDLGVFKIISASSGPMCIFVFDILSKLTCEFIQN